ncbi:hypothetical protein OH77DRAFT_698742 [Trametes cingulata]|nr:hypothetical protein OH77DRAFT_698742 [Trametes cingulata]
MYCPGYFAFPPPGAPLSATGCGANAPPETQENEKQLETAEEAKAKAKRAAEERAREEERKAREATLRARTAADAELALQGEIEYVRMGFSIRDKYGRVDKERTAFIRAEMQRRDELANPAKQWEAYETRWRALLASREPVIFLDIPWPMAKLALSVEELDPDKIVDFFLHSLDIPGCTVSRYDRFRGAMLRWHPDKMSAVVARTVKFDLADVREGINIVFRALHEFVQEIRDQESP